MMAGTWASSRQPEPVEDQAEGTSLANAEREQLERRVAALDQRVRYIEERLRLIERGRRGD